MTALDPIREAEAARVLRESMAELATDEALALDTIEGETGLFEAIDGLLRGIDEDRAHVAGLEVVIGDMDARKARFAKRVDARRALIEQAMMIAEIPKLERPAATLSLTTRAPKVEVSVEADIPAEFWKASDPKLDKKAVGEALKAGRTVPGACLSNAAPTLTVRTK